MDCEGVLLSMLEIVFKIILIWVNKFVIII